MKTKPTLLALSASLSLGLAHAGEGTMLQAEKLNSGYQNSAPKDGATNKNDKCQCKACSCGEGKCQADKCSKEAATKEKNKEGKCGVGKCGEGKCGS